LFRDPRSGKEGGVDKDIERGSQWVAYLDEANVGGLLTEALTADVESVLADETGLVGADTAIYDDELAFCSAPQTIAPCKKAP